MYNIPIAPFLNITFYVTSIFWEMRQGTPHRGVDLDPSGSQNYPIYSILDGTVIDKGYTSSAGNYIIIKENSVVGTATRMLHLKDPALVNVGDTVAKYQLIGYEGESGDAQGIHLHLEMKEMGASTVWRTTNVRSDYLDPCQYLGFPNVQGTAVRCDYTPPTPPTTVFKKSFPWVLYANKLRNNVK